MNNTGCAKEAFINVGPAQLTKDTAIQDLLKRIESAKCRINELTTMITNKTDDLVGSQPPEVASTAKEMDCATYGNGVVSELMSQMLYLEGALAGLGSQVERYCDNSVW